MSPPPRAPARALACALACALAPVPGRAEFPWLNRSAEGLLMGDAFTAVADDGNALFYNPAALGRHEGLSISAVNPRAEASDLLEKDIRKLRFRMDERYKDWPSDPEGVVARAMGLPFHASVAGSPTIQMDRFGLAAFASSTTRMVLENAVHPNLDLDHRHDRGVVAGWALRLGTGGGGRTLLGMAVKRVERRGLSGRHDLFGPELIRLTEDVDDYQDLRGRLGHAEGRAWGWDAGVEHVLATPAGELVLGVSHLNVGGMRFRGGGGAERLPEQEPSLNLGAALRRRWAALDWTLALDHKNAIDPLHSSKSRFSVGTRLAFPLLTAYLGSNGGHPSYGVGVNLFPFEVAAGFYGVETGRGYRQRKGKRALVLVRLLDIHLGS